MEEYLQSALEIVKAQAGSRPMTEDEILSMIKSVAGGIAGLVGGQALPVGEDAALPAQDPKKAIKEASIVCLECGKSFKVITKSISLPMVSLPRNIAPSTAQKNPALACKSLAGAPCQMKDMKLWNAVRKPIKASPREPGRSELAPPSAVTTRASRSERAFRVPGSPMDKTLRQNASTAAGRQDRRVQAILAEAIRRSAGISGWPGGRQGQ